jgi:Fe-S-cluster formation regulator IscX/YfhJ
MEKLGIEFKPSGTGSYSPWHLDIAREYNVNLICTCDTCNFVKIGDDVYKLIKPRDFYKLYQYVVVLEEMNDKGEASDEEVLKEIDDIVNNRNKDFTLEKCVPLDEFEKKIIELSNKQYEKDKVHKT